jgi:hypothetical protein
MEDISLGVCVRMAAPPLRLTQIVSILPGFLISSELDHQIDLHLLGRTPGQVKNKALLPGESFPLHPPREAVARGLTKLCKMYLRDGASQCEEFSIEPHIDGTERPRSFHVRMVVPDEIGPPRFVQVAVQQAELPAKENMPYLCGGYCVVLRGQNFSGSEDVLFDIENKTSHSFFFQVSGASLDSAIDLKRETSRRDISRGSFLMLKGQSHQWVHRCVSSRNEESRYHISVTFFRDFQCQDEMCSVELGSALTKRPNTAVAEFLKIARAKVNSWRVEQESPAIVHVQCSISVEGASWNADAQLTLVEEEQGDQKAMEGLVVVTGAKFNAGSEVMVDGITVSAWTVTNTATGWLQSLGRSCHGHIQENQVL